MSAPDPHRTEPFLPTPVLLLAAALCCLAACGPREESAEPGATIDVEPPLEVATDDDAIEVRRAGAGLTGILPGGFPSDVPLLLPASLVDYGETAGAAYVELVTPKGRADVEQGLAGLLRDRGWSLLEGSAEGTPGEMRLVKGGRPLRVIVRDGAGGSVYRLIY